MEKIIQFIKNWFEKLTDGRKRLIVLTFTAFFAVIITLSVILSLINSPARQRSAQPQRASRYDPIPPQEIFLPDEPDFVPGVLLERERRTSWTEQDAAVFWQDPLRYGEEQWRENIEIVIDEFMEKIP